ncbi:hypothetical protein EMGBS15_14050 [Filimonas sp.]|nr:hypothetical protein EMGBS15_14050 [Filimonas sp.]
MKILELRHFNNEYSFMQTIYSGVPTPKHNHTYIQKFRWRGRAIRYNLFCYASTSLSMTEKISTTIPHAGVLFTLLDDLT